MRKDFIRWDEIVDLELRGKSLTVARRLHCDETDESDSGDDEQIKFAEDPSMAIAYVYEVISDQWNKIMHHHASGTSARGMKHVRSDTALAMTRINVKAQRPTTSKDFEKALQSVGLMSSPSPSFSRERAAPRSRSSGRNLSLIGSNNGVSRTWKLQNARGTIDKDAEDERVMDSPRFGRQRNSPAPESTLARGESDAGDSAANGEVLISKIILGMSSF